MKKISAQQLLITFVPSILVLLVLVLTSIFLQVSISDMTRDFTAIADIHPLSGVLSNLGVLLWCAAASICGFTAYILRNAKPGDPFRFAFSSSLLSAYLLFDDFFLFHDGLVYWYLGSSETVVFVALGIAVSAYLLTFRRIILRTNFGALVLALGFLSTSLFLDLIQPWLLGLGHCRSLLEDGPKWLGIAFWCSYYVNTSHQLLVNALGLPNNATVSDACASRR